MSVRFGIGKTTGPDARWATGALRLVFDTAALRKLRSAERRGVKLIRRPLSGQNFVRESWFTGRGDLALFALIAGVGIGEGSVRNGDPSFGGAAAGPMAGMVWI
jgi:hypothetical protein